MSCFSEKPNNQANRQEKARKYGGANRTRKKNRREKIIIIISRYSKGWGRERTSAQVAVGGRGRMKLMWGGVERIGSRGASKYDAPVGSGERRDILICHTSSFSFATTVAALHGRRHMWRSNPTNTRADTDAITSLRSCCRAFPRRSWRCTGGAGPRETLSPAATVGTRSPLFFLLLLP